jgi:CubicO group peptidase (beta-lactamase class C family)
MTQRTLASIEPRVREVLQQHAVPGVVVAVARGGRPIEHLVVGVDACGHTLAADSLFPVASITKLATALCVLRLVDTGTLHYEDRLGAYLPEAAAADAGVSLRMLLTHTAGLQGMEDTIAPWTENLSWTVLAGAAMKVTAEIPPGTRVAYSDVHYILLAMMIERLTGQSFPAACRQLVLDPLGIEGYLGEEPPRSPTTIGHEPYSGTSVEWHNSMFFRSLGLPASGLVTSAAGALALVQAFAGTPQDFLCEETRAAATRDQTGGLSGGYRPIHEPPEFSWFPWGLGPTLRDHLDPHIASGHAHPESFGHGGSSGCVTWADPSAGIAWSILGTRHAGSGWSRPGLGSISAAILTTAR